MLVFRHPLAGLRARPLLGHRIVVHHMFASNLVSYPHPKLLLSTWKIFRLMMSYITGTVRTRINEPCARTLELPLLVWSGLFFFLFVSELVFFGVFFAPFPEEEILDDIARGSFIRVLTVVNHHTAILEYARIRGQEVPLFYR